MTYRYDTTRRRAYFGYHGKQSFVDAPSRADGFKVALESLRYQMKNSIHAFT